MGPRFVFGHRISQVRNESFTTTKTGDHFTLVHSKEKDSDRDFIAIHTAFSALNFSNQKALDSLLVSSEIKDIPAETVLCAKGDLSDEVYIVLRGQIAVGETNNPNSIVLSSGSITGEMSCLNHQPRNARLETLSACRIGIIPATDFRKFVGDHRIIDSFQRLWSYRTSIMNAHGFRDLPIEVIHLITKNLETIELQENQTIVQQGELSDEAYIVSEGCLKVKRNGNIVATLSTGDIFGEKSALYNEQTPRSATIYAVNECSLLRLEGSVLRELNRKYLVVNQLLRLLLKERNLIRK